MAFLMIMLALFILCNQITFLSSKEHLSTKIEDLLHMIEIFSKKYDGDNCSQTLLKTSHNLSTIANRNFMDTWKLTTSLELYSLNWYNLVGEDMKCKLSSDKIVEENYLNRYCLYEIYNDSLADGFLFAFCIPPSCNESHIEMLGQLAHNRGRKDTALDKKSTNIQCSRRYTSMDRPLEFSALLIIILILIFTTAVASILHERNKGKAKVRELLPKKWITFIEIFSDQSTCKKLVSSNPNTDINILNVMRVLSMLIMVFGHFHECSLMVAENREDFRNPNNFLWLCSNATIFIGTFFVIGGTLTTYRTLCKKEDSPDVNVNEPLLFSIKSSIVPWSVEIANRYIRLIFMYFFFILFYTYILPNVIFFIPYINGDPSVQCPPRMLKHLLMISNFDYKPYCMVWAWYLDVDFQLFIFSRPLVWLFVHKPFWAFVTSILLCFCSCTIRATLMLWFDFPPAMSYIMQFPQYNLDSQLNHLHIHSKPYTWLSSYLVGMSVGYAAFHLRLKSTFTLNSLIQKCLWVCTLIFVIYSIFGIFWHGNGFKNVFYDITYIVCAPLMWSLACGWIILHSHNFSASTCLQTFYKLKVFTVLSNLSFGCCLINLPIAYFIVAFYSYYSYEEPKVYLSNVMFFVLYVATCVLSFTGAFLLCLVVEGPASHIRVRIPKRYAKSKLKSS